MIANQKKNTLSFEEASGLCGEDQWVSTFEYKINDSGYGVMKKHCRTYVIQYLGTLGGWPYYRMRAFIDDRITDPEGRRMFWEKAGFEWMQIK